MMVSFVLFFFPRGVLDEILNLIESVSEGFPSYFFKGNYNKILDQLMIVDWNQVFRRRQTACLVVNPIKVNSFAYLFNCTTVGRTSD